MTAATNGALPAALLATTTGGKRLSIPAAASYERLCATFQARFGIPLRFNAGWTGYRDLAAQQLLFAQLGYPRAAVPGTSNHGLGVAADLALTYGSVQWQWMNTTGRTHGWRPLNERNLAFEPWHWQYSLALDQHAQDTTTQEDDMRIIRRGPDGGFYALDGGVAWNITAAERDALVAAGVPYRDVTQAQGDAILAAYSATGRPSVTVPAIAQAVWGYKNPAVTGGDRDVYSHLRGLTIDLTAVKARVDRYLEAKVSEALNVARAIAAKVGAKL